MNESEHLEILNSLHRLYELGSKEDRVAAERGLVAMERIMGRLDVFEAFYSGELTSSKKWKDGIMKKLTLISSMLLILFILIPSTVFAASTTLTWVDTSNNETGFNIERKAEPCASTTLPFTALITVGANITTYIDTTVIIGKTYCYRVNAGNQFGSSGYSNTASITITGLPPTPPTTLTAKPGLTLKKRVKK